MAVTTPDAAALATLIEEGKSVDATFKFEPAKGKAPKITQKLVISVPKPAGT
mgnify:CR=1 FL=1